MSTDKDERWYVQFDSGDVTLMTLDEIQEAFEAGKIHANTYLIEVGDSEWKTLSVVAGLDDEGHEEEEELTPAPQPVPQAAPPAPVLQSGYAAAMPQPGYGAAAAQQGFGPQTQTLRGHAPPVQPALQQRVPSVAAGGWPPVATAAPQSSLPAGARPATLSSAPPSYQAPYSVMPVTADLDVGFDASSFKSGKRTALIAALVALPALGGGIYGLTKLDSPPAPAPVAAAAAAPAAMPRPNSWSSPASTPTPSTPTPSSDSGSTSTGNSDSSGSASSGSSGKLSEDMKKALLAQDSERSAKKKAARSSAPARRSSGKKTGDVFKAGGSASDPLNSKL